MRREEMLCYLGELDTGDRFPMWVISYNRAGSAPMLERMKGWKHQDELVNLVVRQSQAAAYRRAYPRFRVHPVPDTNDCVGFSRDMAFQLAYQLGHSNILMFDDDIIALRFLFQRAFTRGKNVGQECSGHSTLEDIAVLPDLDERIVTGMARVGTTVMARHLRAVIGGAIKQHMSFSPKNHQTMYTLNGGVTPRQAMVWAVDRMMERNITLNVERFGLHGDDIGIVAEALAAGADCWAMPSFAYEHWPESINIKKSVIRNSNTAKKLHEYEWESLMQYPIKDYLRAKRDSEGQFMWGEVNWQKLAKLRGKPMLLTPWETLL